MSELGEIHDLIVIKSGLFRNWLIICALYLISLICWVVKNK